MMKNFLIAVALCWVSLSAAAQDVEPFRGYFYNEEFQVWLDLDFYEQNVEIPGQEIFGQMPGYMGAQRDTRKWIVATVKLVNKSTAKVEISNDYGSEDLEATLSYKKADDAVTLKQEKGSPIKIVVNRKWVKLPKSLTFVRQKRPSAR